MKDKKDEYYSSEKEAVEYGLSCYQLGGELLEMSNLSDYPYDLQTMRMTHMKLLKLMTDQPSGVYKKLNCWGSHYNFWSSLILSCKYLQFSNIIAIF